MPNNFPILVGSGATPTSGDYLVRFIDFDGTILKEQWVNAGQAATAPTPPTHQYLTFDEWNNDFANIQHDLDVGATYYTTDGKAYLFMRFTNTTGMQPTIYLNKADTQQMNINWGDGTGASLSGSGNIAITKAAPYAAIGDYIITIECAGNWNTYTYIFANISAYKGCLLKFYAGIHLTSIGNSTFRNANSLVSIALHKNLLLGLSTFFSSPSIKCIVVPKINTTIYSALVSSVNIEFIVFPMSVSSIDTYLANGGNISRIILPDNITVLKQEGLRSNPIKSISIPDNVTTIEAGYFCECFNLGNELVLPYKIISLGGNTFYDCINIHRYICLATTPPTIASNTFNAPNDIMSIYVADASIVNYQGATNWVSIATRILPISLLAEYAGTIFFQCNGGNAIKQIKGTAGAVATEPTAPTKTGFTFAGWYKEAALTNAWNWASDVYPATNITLYAKWV
jgi:uncharacterized repeat protein (TIGR02543 family)